MTDRARSGPVGSQGISAVASVALIGLISAGLLVSITAGSGASLVYFGSYASVGAYLAARRPSSPIGWLLLLTGFGLAMGSVVVHTTLADMTAGAMGAAEVALTLSVWAIATFVLLLPGDGPSLTLVVLSSPTVPLAVAIAVLRYRLFAIDRLISRSVSWALVTGVLVAAFGALVIGLQSLLSDVTQGETLAVAISTLAAFAVFQPVRRQVQATVDRRFDRAHYDRQQTVDPFAGRIRDEVDLSTLRHDLVVTTDDAVRPVTSTVWLRPSRGPTR